MLYQLSYKGEKDWSRRPLKDDDPVTQTYTWHMRNVGNIFPLRERGTGVEPVKNGMETRRLTDQPTSQNHGAGRELRSPQRYLGKVPLGHRIPASWGPREEGPVTQLYTWHMR